MNKVLKNKNGFTLVELIVIMAVLGVISSIAVPRFLGVQEEAKVDADYATGAMLAKAAELYLVNDDNNVDNLNNITDVETLQDELNTTDIKFVSKNLIGNEDTIRFSEDDAVISVSATNNDDTATVVLYPRPED